MSYLWEPSRSSWRQHNSESTGYSQPKGHTLTTGDWNLCINAASLRPPGWNISECIIHGSSGLPSRTSLLLLTVVLSSVRNLRLTLSPCSTLPATPLLVSGITYQNKLPPVCREPRPRRVSLVFCSQLPKCVSLLLAVPLDVDIPRFCFISWTL